MTISIEATIQKLINEAIAAAEQRILTRVTSADKTMDVQEAAAHMGISATLLYRMCQERGIPHERYGAIGSKRPTIKFRLSDLEAWRAEQRTANYKPFQFQNSQ